MGGEISLESTPEQGTTFTFTAQVRKLNPEMGRRKQEPTSLESTRSLPSIRVLVVDDNATSRETLRTLLQAWHSDVAVAESGDAALRLMKEAVESRNPFDVAILDEKMPGLGGAEAERK